MKNITKCIISKMLTGHQLPTGMFRIPHLILFHNQVNAIRCTYFQLFFDFSKFDIWFFFI